MRCPAKKVWSLFYYKELRAKESERLTEHLKSCSSCQGYYNSLSNTLSGISRTEVDLLRQELSRMVSRVTGAKTTTEVIFESFKAKTNDLAKQLRSKLFYQPQLIFVTVAVLLIALIVPLRRQQVIFQNQLLNLEVDLVLGQDDFESYLDLYSLDEHSQNPSSTTISS